MTRSVNIPLLKSRTSLPEIVADYVRLTKRGPKLWGQCPFHTEKTASFSVGPEYFHCFGCGARGDVIDFTAQIDGISKGRAIAVLAERYGIETGPAPTRRESQYLRDLRAQAEFWWARKRAAAIDRLNEACSRLTDDPDGPEAARATAAGRYVRMLDSIPPNIRGRAFLHLRKTTDAAEWDCYLRDMAIMKTFWMHHA